MTKVFFLKHYVLVTFVTMILVGCSGSTDALLEKGKELMKAGKTQEALQFLNQAVEKDLTNAQAFNVRGVAYLELKQPENALLDFDQAIKLNSKNYQPYFNRATLKAEQGNWSDAIKDIEEAARIQPDTAEIFVKMGMIRAATGDFIKAISDFDKALKLNPKEKNAIYNKGNLLFQQQQYTDAIELDGKFSKAFYALGLAQQKIGQTEAACINLKKANRLGYTDAQVAIKQYCE
jgi:tetratricopeptide (TPR) repeat protein